LVTRHSTKAFGAGCFEDNGYFEKHRNTAHRGSVGMLVEKGKGVII
jgi:hypothetical protein